MWPIVESEHMEQKKIELVLEQLAQGQAPKWASGDRMGSPRRGSEELEDSLLVSKLESMVGAGLSVGSEELRGIRAGKRSL